MTQSTSPLIHIGYAKAGSTWLQAHLLGNSRLGFQMPFNRADIRRLLQKAPAFEFDAGCCREYFEPGLQMADPEHEIPVLSFEGLTGPSRMGDFQRKAIADRLFQVFPNAKIFLMIREQGSMQLAQYHQYLRRGGVYSLSRFLHPPMSDRRQLPYFDWNRFSYHHLINYYQQLFGDNNVLVLPLEMLQQNPHAFVGRLAEFCGLEVSHRQISELPVADRTRPSQSSLLMNVRRPFNFLFGQSTSFNPRSFMPLRNTQHWFNAWGSVADRLLPSVVREWQDNRASKLVATTLGDYYAESNLATSQLTGLNLEDFGYVVAAELNDDKGQTTAVSQATPQPASRTPGAA